MCARLARRLQEVREAAGFSQYGLGKESGVSREMINCVEREESGMSLFMTARLAFA